MDVEWKKWWCCVFSLVIFRHDGHITAIPLENVLIFVMKVEHIYPFLFKFYWSAIFGNEKLFVSEIW